MSYFTFLRLVIGPFIKCMPPPHSGLHTHLSALLSPGTALSGATKYFMKKWKPFQCQFQYFKQLENYVLAVDLQLGQVGKDLKKVTQPEVLLFFKKKITPVKANVTNLEIHFKLKQPGIYSIPRRGTSKLNRHCLKSFRNSATAIRTCHTALSGHLNLDCSLL